MAHDQTIIIGGGIIGLCTAYYHAQAHTGDGSSITVVDNAPRLLLGASGLANGCVNDGKDIEGKCVDSLCALSWRLYKELDDTFDGVDRWCYRPEKTIKIIKKEALDEDEEMASWPRWIPKSDLHVAAPVFDNVGDVMHIHPRLFGEFLIERCTQMGVKIHCSTQVTRVDFAKDKVTQAHLQDRSGKQWSQNCQNILISAGPWTPQILSKLFPDAKIGLKLDPHYPSSHSLNVRDPTWNSAHGGDSTSQTLFESILETPLNMTNYSNGIIYVGTRLVSFNGEPCADHSESLPSSISDINQNQGTLQELHQLAAQQLGLSSPTELEILSQGRAYYSTLSNGRIVTAAIPPSLLLPYTRSAAENSGVFISLGHGSGIGQGPGNGKVLSEMLLGRNPCIDMTPYALSE